MLTKNYVLSCPILLDTYRCSNNRDYLLSVKDIKQWEAKYGIIPDNSWVLMYTGIDTKY